MLYIDSLLPNQTYKLIAAMQQSNNVSNEVTVTTMDTTSHNFTFQTFTFGEHSSSTLYDVAIINENNIWAVGEIYMNDSVGNPDPNRYNAVKWNGSTWDVIRIPYNFQGTDFYNPIQSVFAFNNNDIWFCGNGVIHWNISEFTPIPIPTNVWGPYQMNKIWGTSSNDLYVVGSDGNIAHYKNGNWTKIESGTSIDLEDIWGVENENGNFIKFIAADSHMLMLDVDNKIASVIVAPNMILLSIWGKKPNLLYTAGKGVVLYKNYEWESISNSNVNHMYRVRGQGLNDVYGISSPGNIINHFNGYSWNSIETESENKYWTLSVIGNIIVAVGYQLEQAVITIISK